jgi:hypothetical protein
MVLDRKQYCNRDTEFSSSKTAIKLLPRLLVNRFAKKNLKSENSARIRVQMAGVAQPRVKGPAMFRPVGLVT